MVHVPDENVLLVSVDRRSVSDIHEVRVANPAVGYTAEKRRPL
jgi:hypothetical protein